MLQVFVVQHDYQAGIKCFKVEYNYNADLHVFTVNHDYNAKWNKDHVMQQWL